jgi:fructuronate reductase/mannitol 2-dehydrogenase
VIAVALNERTLRHHARRVSVPRYDRWALRRGVVHLSVGSFHRAHQAVYFDDLAHLGFGNGWALTGIGLRRPHMKEVLRAQDGLYTVVTRGGSRQRGSAWGGGDSARIIGIITRYLFAPEQTPAAVSALTDESTRLVTLTITAGGYRGDHRALAAGPAGPPTALTLLVDALSQRRRLGRAPITVLSCDNLADNGGVARRAVTSVAALRDPSLSRWIDEHVAFPSSMVDRITPCTTEDDRRLVERSFGVKDRSPVMTEPFAQWVIEDSFCNARPPLDAVGAQFVSDVRPYALMKTRLLNGSHVALGYLGTLAGHERLDQVMADPALSAYAEHVMTDEVGPLISAPGMDVMDYGATLRARFANPAIPDPLARLCRNGTAKVTAHLLSSIREARVAGRPHVLLTLAVAAWCHYLRGDPGRRGHRWSRPDPSEDPDGARLRRLAQNTRGDVGALLADEQTFGSLGRCPRFAAAIRRDVHDLATCDPRDVIDTRLAQAAPVLLA